MLEIFREIQELNGDDRVQALKADVKSRALDVASSPAKLGKVS